jgi:YgiT-type zinc finger domain-containing protein
MKCYFCGGHTQERIVTDLYTEGNLYLAVENVPADVCDQCGERYYSPEVMKRLLALTNGMREHAAVGPPGRKADLTLCDFAAGDTSTR